MTNTFRAAAALVLLYSLAFAGHRKVARDLESVAPADRVNVIVEYKEEAFAKGETPEQKHRNVPGLARVATLRQLNSEVLSVHARDLALLADNEDVEFIRPDRAVAAHTFSGYPDYGWITAGAHAATAEFGTTGQGIGIAVIDSGIAPHADFATNNIRYSTHTISTEQNAFDAFGHGTHVAGIIAGNGRSSSTGTYTVRGVAPGAHLVILRALGANGAGTDSSVILAIEKAIALRSTYNIRVLNLSVGRPVFESYRTDPLCRAVEKAWKAGIVVVVAAGNEGRNNTKGTDGYATIAAPANSPWVITVGAMNTVGTPVVGDDKVASFSSKGPTAIDHIVKPDLVAPGAQVLSLNAKGSVLEKTHPENVVPAWFFRTTTPQYYQLSGTSMAAAVVSGAAALVLQKTPALTPDQVKYRLMRTANRNLPTETKVTDPVTGITYTSKLDLFTIGAGYLNIVGALRDTSLVTGTAESPTARYDSTTRRVSMVYSSAAMWGSAAVWGTATMWGTAAVWGTAAIWGTSAPAATAAIWGSAAISGTAAIWGTGTTAGSAAVWGTSSIVATDER